MGFSSIKLKYSLIFVILAVFVVVLISNLIRQQGGATTCDLPYKKIGTDCCLDQNNNSICDTNETLADNGQVNDTDQEEPELNDTTGLACTKGYADEYNCSSQYITRKYYLDADCSYKWIKWGGVGFFANRLIMALLVKKNGLIIGLLRENTAIILR